jgi:hypothetical protein
MKKQKGKDRERIEKIIDENLKLVYADLAEDELPDRFKDLLAVLKAQDAAKKDNG